MSALSGMSPSYHESILHRGDYRCVYCNLYLYPYRDPRYRGSLDHVQPRSHNGAHETTNIVPACRYHNYSRGNRSIRRYVRDLYPHDSAAQQRVLDRIASQLSAPVDRKAAYERLKARGVLTPSELGLTRRAKQQTATNNVTTIAAR